MGLEMYAYTLEAAPDEPVDFKATGHKEIHYWWKHLNLHDWMAGLYRDKGGSAMSFNCVNLELTGEDLDALEEAIRSGSLQPSDFVAGEADGSEPDDDLQFIAKARDAIAAGLTVFYSSWW